MLASLPRAVLKRDAARLPGSADGQTAPRPMATDGRFVRQASVLALGTILGQLGVLAGAPLLTRIYQPDAIGAWAFLSTIAMALANVANCKYELAIVLPRSDARAVNLAALCLFIQLGVLALVALAIVFTQSHAAGSFLDASIPLHMLWLLVPLTSALSFYAISRYWFLRKQQFRTLAIFVVLEAWLLSGAQIVAGITIGADATQLILAGVAAISTLALVFGIAVTLQMRRFGGSLRAAQTLALAKRYRNFPMYSAPYAFLGMASSRALLILFGIYATPAAIGFLALAMRVTSLPGALVSSALNNAFFGWAARYIHEPGAFAALIRNVLHPMIILGTPGVVLFALNAEWLFSIVFGPDWVEAGRYAKYLVIGAFALLLCIWLDSVYSVLQKQKVSLILEGIFDVVMLTSVFICLAIYRDTLLAVIVFSIATALYNFVWLIIMFRIVKLPAALFFEIIGLLALMVLISLAVHGVGNLLMGPLGYALFCAGFLIMLGVYTGRRLLMFAQTTSLEATS
jgi:O-antigen/teichoic acid export membrane protein